MNRKAPFAPLPKEEHVRRLADALRACRMAAPAVLALEFLKPWRVVLGQFLLMCEPLWGSSARTGFAQYAEWIAEGDCFDALLKALEAPSTPLGDSPHDAA